MKSNSTNIVALPDENASHEFAKSLANYIKAPLFLGFTGEIGMGKTTIIRFLLQSLGVSSRIKSPTFSLIESYNVANLALHHFDLYRINDDSELDYIGFRDYFAQDAVFLIEWPERLGNYQSDLDVLFKLSRVGSGRSLEIVAYKKPGMELLANLQGLYEKLPSN